MNKIMIESISSDETYEIMKRFPKIELSYETIPHKKVSPTYNICCTIIQGKKGYIWFSFYKDEDVCFFMEINREKKISKIRIININFDRSLSLGTIFYGTLVENEGKKQIFIIEDIFFYKGITMKNSLFKERLGFLDSFFQKDLKDFLNNEIILSLPAMWYIDQDKDYECEYKIPDFWKTRIINFPIHHLQYRSLSERSPYMNVFNQNVFINANTKKEMPNKPLQTKLIIENFNKPQFKIPTVFLISADIQYDIYHLFVYGKGSQTIYYNIAYIPNYKTSVFMNKIFRKIRENDNLDYIEESEDEEDFQNNDEDKFVDLQKMIMMECIFSPKFKKWIPTKIVKGEKVVHISQLTNYY
jgi:hypothetical protein